MLSSYWSHSISCSSQKMDGTRMEVVSRVDIVWDQYHENSLKSHTRSKHGKGITRRVASLQGNWQQLLQINSNKRKLFSFLVKHISQMVVTKQIVTTNEVLCIPPQDTYSLAPCNHEEVDTCQLLITGDPTTGNYCGPHFLSQVLHPENCFTVGARKLACRTLCLCGGECDFETEI